ncbi:heavy metal translocating P-type ATPase [Heyndrickxia sp. NPDC080065]|uniref:heavy metal translocating P-type ATPase n=1 Tax=Heyndrickxia sp. NPDC080065 TaxID=3390568 RepID=UPI003D01528A
MNGEVAVIHSLPGRTRLYIPSELLPVQVECFFRSIKGIYSATYTKETCSLLLHHEQTLSLQSIINFAKTFMSIKISNHIFSWQQYGSLVSCISVLIIHSAVNRIPILLPLRPILYKTAATTALLSSIDVIKDGITTVFKNRKVNANTLTAASIFASIYNGNPASALVITIMSTISEKLSEYTAEKTKNYISSLMELDTKYAWRLNPAGEEVKVSVKELNVSDHIVVFTGEKIPADGRVLEGSGIVDESSITGEYMPKVINVYENLFAGSILKSGHIVMEVEKVGDDTAISRMLKLLEEAQKKRAPIQNTADSLAEKMVPFSFGLALVTYLITRNLNRAMNMLVIDFVCGLKLSTATAFYASMGKAAKQGIIVKGSHNIEQTSTIDMIILDKTGTITEGSPVVQQVFPCDGFYHEDVIRLAAIAEKNSSHPIAEAILKQVEEWKIQVPNRDANTLAETIVGKGVRCYFDRKPIVVGSLSFFKELKINVDHFPKTFDYDENVIYVAYDHTLVGIISIFDKIRTGMPQAIRKLRKQGIGEVVMLTGDKRSVAKEMARRLNFNWYHAETLPEDKVTYVKQYRRRHSVMMVGDGINDAPALAYANVGVTMGGKRTDIASEASDIIITSDNPELIPAFINLSKRTMNIIRQNFVATFFINGAAILLGACGFISPIMGAAIHNTATIGVILNSAKILWIGDKDHGTEILYSS